MTSTLKTNPPMLFADYKSQQQTLSARINYFKTGMTERVRLEDFISHVYKKFYNAEIEHFYPNLISIETNQEDRTDQEQSIKAVAGVRCAKNEALFSEYYLNDSLENELQRIYHKPISRQVVVEVGNLAPKSVGQTRWLITTLTGFLYSAGYEYIVFTLVPGIANAFKRMNIPLELLAEAKHECLPKDIQHKWGPEYYQKKPMVLTGNITLAFNIVKENIYQLNKELIPLFEKACHLGQQENNLNPQERAHFKRKVA
ncbi:MAG: thermostable hemolysin [gamma proteobacterium symbiont of Bathyaustriella thionipta]|nr:thermostable hemolysin [gamma proteobacterium symbiont of Bathyaustriella thionipta]MCU7950533.1 thermostable hemolysin [gamma proteobacterium symbiont of Bathyaustriella thionipta]MCU7951847.1 thermostable hemolysin [gamma proteobacterium symbiont of Bathyaustriella thionipta]MCU7957027.1 thermostable hemolysin [gamma proteobacterium symbiont of Bathyaustriella thionipta]MCU7968855.1 thermostable hemolysin [gamma proteobacterium symbiont of Bathyaustriella thionipta]